MAPPFLPDLIVTADDLGSSREINRAIAQGLRDGYLTHASMMVNLGEFEDARSRLAGNGFANRIGLHLNLTDGPPLTRDIAHCPRFCCDGAFRFPPQGRGLWPLSRAERRAVAAEVRAQLDRLRDAGFPVTHLDSHHHVHMEPNLARVILPIAQAAGIARVRPPKFADPSQGRLHRLKDALYRRQAARGRFRRELHLGDLDDAQWYFAHGGRPAPPMAILTHPVFDAAGAVAEGGERELLRDRLLRLRPYMSSLIDDAGRVRAVLEAAG